MSADRETASKVTTVLLWLLIINLGVALGAGLYESRIVLPTWIDTSGGSAVWNPDTVRADDTGLRFWVAVTTVPLTLLTLANLVAGWRSPSELRRWWLAAAGTALVERALTLGYFITDDGAADADGEFAGGSCRGRSLVPAERLSPLSRSGRAVGGSQDVLAVVHATRPNNHAALKPSMAHTDQHAHDHWETVYQTKSSDQVSWFQPEARLSRELIEQAVPDRSASIIDIGGGASTLVDGLTESGYRSLKVLDLSETALAIARHRMGAATAHVAWQVANVLDAPFPTAAFDLWHDRAVFHFLTAAADRERYVAQVRHAVRRGGHVLMATFAEDGPARCSGLDVARYSAESLRAQFGAGFEFVTSRREVHRTPNGVDQAFTYCLCRFEP